MSNLVGAVCNGPAADALRKAVERLGADGYSEASWLAMSGGEISGAREPFRIAALATRWAELEAQCVILRLDWQASRDNGDAPPDQQIAVQFRGAIANIGPVIDHLLVQGLSPSDRRPASVFAALLRWHLTLQPDLLRAVHAAVHELKGVFSCAVMSRAHPQQVICATQHAQMLLATTPHGTLFADQVTPLQALAAEFVRLEHGDVARLTPDRIEVIDIRAIQAHRAPEQIRPDALVPDFFQHYMEKEIREQPIILADTLGRHGLTPDLAAMLGDEAARLLPSVESVVLIGVGSSGHAALTARYWIEALTGLPTAVETASEYRFREAAMPRRALVVGISQSGETLDTLAAIAQAQKLGAQYTLAISNVADSSLMRTTHFQYCTEAGPEIGVTSTKSFTTQLLALYQLALGLSRALGFLTNAEAATIEGELAQLPESVNDVLRLEPQFAQWAHRLIDHPLLLCTARHMLYPIAMEAAHKFQEVAYLHAEGYPGGELKHGPLALVDRDLPVIACMPWNRHAEKLLTNLQEVRARRGELFVLSDAALAAGERFNAIRMPAGLRGLNPVLYAVAMQMLAYRAALNLGTEIDAPRNLTKTAINE
ncbi:glutamine--fructose-6-phosphate transaminase (isomerizing) [Chitiniphilus shinanonensis]|uniref:glutamine--fructose-6-phosphate transaminase (isomerizing) n=1 Tax=Chitiniphilus shinanonensis TaxID=553088 RepID=UPI003032158A